MPKDWFKKHQVIKSLRVKPTREQRAKLNAAGENVVRSIPASDAKYLRDYRVLIADLFSPGAACGTGKVILFDRAAIDKMTEGQLENLIAHELAHMIRAKKGISADDRDVEEEETEQLTRSWGFRRAKYRRDYHAQQS